eukprot:TRINITY_DN2790_c2_g1_i1.p1 TRINITY_DN2790_c2_g1~~TRINITY_DN2790_c2_g1_i1.p1  ORF type:complete len:366 (-),score=77.53 TRINITY_DN2790_c2_g1_i1:211-1308(-)
MPQVRGSIFRGGSAAPGFAHEASTHAKVRSLAGKCTYGSERDRSALRELLSENGWALKYARPPYRADRDVVLAAVTHQGAALEFAAEELRGDPAVVRRALERSGGTALRFASAALRADPGVALAALKACQASGGSAMAVLDFVARSLCQDPDWLLKAAKYCGDLRHVMPAALSKDQEFVKALVERRSGSRILAAAARRQSPLLDSSGFEEYFPKPPPTFSKGGDVEALGDDLKMRPRPHTVAGMCRREEPVTCDGCALTEFAKPRHRRCFEDCWAIACIGAERGLTPEAPPGLATELAATTMAKRSSAARGAAARPRHRPALAAPGSLRKARNGQETAEKLYARAVAKQAKRRSASAMSQRPGHA